ncbi:MAG: LamG-like jellyroll fold domain-containing protein, partial [Saprospiraceae bacterium]|nr:LamG-like jellyroll fold domain-containing protein [Saprospiraceae bacterium]
PVSAIRPRPGYEYAWNNLLFAHIGYWSPTQKRAGTYYDGASVVTDPTYGAVLDTGTADGGVYYDREKFDGSTGLIQTLVVLMKVDAWDSYCSFFKIPWVHDNSWADPYNSVSFNRLAAGTQAQFALVRTSDQSDRRFETSTDYLANADGVWHQYVMSRFSDTTYFYRDGEYFEDISGAGMDTSIDWGTDDAPVHIGQRNYLLAGEHTQGQFAQVLFYNRGMEPEEVAQLWHDPFAAFQPVQSTTTFQSTAAPATSHMLAAMTGVM